MVYWRSSKESSVAGVVFEGRSNGRVLECEVRTIVKDYIT